MSLYDNIAVDSRMCCEKCGRPVACQTRGAMGQFHTFTLSELAAFMATYYDGDGCIMYGYCVHCNHLTYFELQPVTVKRIDDPYKEEEEDEPAM